MSIKGEKRVVIKSPRAYGNLIEKAPDSIVTVDLKGNITYCNQATEALTGYTREELIGKHFTRLSSLEKKEISQGQKLFRALRAGKQVAPFEMKVRHKDGKPYWIEVYLSRIKANGKVIGFQINTRNITERKKIEMALIRKEKIAAERARLLNDLRSLDRIDDILTRVCETVRDSGLFERAVMTLHQPGGEITYLGQVGLPSDVVKRARQAPPIDDKLRSQITNKKFRISDSYFIPAEADLNYRKTRRHIPQKRKNLNGGGWQPGDELFVPLRDFSGQIMGYLSVDTPIDGCRPDIKTIQALEMLVEAAAGRIREVEAQKALKRERDFIQSIIETANSLIVCLDADGKITAFNKECERVTGYRREEVLGKSWPELFLPPDQHHPGLKSFAKWVRAHPRDQYEGPVVTKNGEIRTILWANNAILGSSKKDVIVIAIGQDITERKQVGEALRESEERFRNLAEQLPNMIFVYQSGRVTYSNRKCEEIMGYKREEFQAPDFDFLTLIAPEDRELVKASLRRHIMGKEVDPYEYAIITKEGKKIQAILSTKLISYLGKDAVLGIITDITERKKAEELLRESENKYRVLIENLPQKVFLKDTNFVYVSCNENYARDLKIKPEEIAGKADYDFYPRELAEKYRSDDKRIIRSGNAEDIEERYIQDGRELWVHTVKTPVKDKKGRCVGLLGIFWDITERKQAEEALQIERDRLETVTQNAGVGLAIISKDYRTLWANEVLKQIFGDVEGKICYSTYNQRSKICSGCGVREIFETGAREVVHEQVGEDKDGKTVWSQIVATPIRDKGGKITGVLEVVVDITERKRVEGALRESEKRYRTLFEDSPISLWEEDFSIVKTFIERLRAKGVKDFRKYFENHPEAVAKCATMVKVIDVNNASLKLFEASRKEDLLRSLGNTFSEESYDAFREELMAIAQGRTTFETEATTRTHKGDKKHLMVRWSVAPGYENTLSKVLVSISDITELKRAREQNLLLETSKALSQTLQLDQVLKIGTEKMAKALNADRCALAFTDQDIQSATVKYVYSEAASPSSIYPGMTVCTRDLHAAINTLRKKGYYQILNSRTDPLPNSLKKYFLRARVKSAIILPMFIGKKLLGLIGVGSVKKLRRFTEEEIRLAQTIANQVAVAVQNALLIEDLKKKHSQIIEQSQTLQRQYQEQSILMKISRELSQTLDMDRVLQIATKEAAQAVGVERCTVLLANPEEGSYSIKSIYGEGERSLSHLLGHKFYVHDYPQFIDVYERKKPINIPNILDLPDNDPIKEYCLKERIKSVLMPPLFHGRKLVGFFILSTMKDFKTFTRDERRLAQTISNQVAVAIENARLLDLVRKSSEDLKAISSQLINVQEDERKKIAQQLHDEVGQTLFAMKMNVDMTKASLPLGLDKLKHIRSRLSDTEGLLTQTIDRVRSLTTDLRPSMLDDFGLIPALNWYIDSFSKRTNIKVYLRTKKLKPRLSSEIETTFYRVIQEALTNVAKHAKATEVSILLAQENSTVSLLIEDNGIGFDIKKATFPKDRLGLFSIKERVELLNGKFEIHSKPNKGTKLNVKIPLTERSV